MKKKLATLTSAAILSSMLLFGYEAEAAKTHTVQKGETLYRIGVNYGVPYETIAKWNNLNNNSIYVNQKLIVSDPALDKKQETAKEVVKEVAKETAKTYTVQKGDTVFKVSTKYNISQANLRTWNNLKNDTIYVGQKLNVSKPGQTVAETPKVETKQPEKVETPKVEVPKAETKQPEKVETPVAYKTANYTVQKGDYLYKIATDFNMTVDELKSMNKLASNVIFSGQLLKVKAKESVKEPAKEENKVQESITPSSSVKQEMINVAKSKLGTPYVWGGVSEKGFDCSGFMYYVLKQTGNIVPRLTVEGYWNRFEHTNTPEPGDFVFFQNTYMVGPSHMGIYLGNGQFIHASSSVGVTITNLNSTYYQQHFLGYAKAPK